MMSENSWDPWRTVLSRPSLSFFVRSNKSLVKSNSLINQDSILCSAQFFLCLFSKYSKRESFQESALCRLVPPSPRDVVSGRERDEMGPPSAYFRFRPGWTTASSNQIFIKFFRGLALLNVGKIFTQQPSTWYIQGDWKLAVFPWGCFRGARK